VKLETENFEPYQQGPPTTAVWPRIPPSTGGTEQDFLGSPFPSPPSDGRPNVEILHLRFLPLLHPRQGPARSQRRCLTRSSPSTARQRAARSAMRNGAEAAQKACPQIFIDDQGHRAAAIETPTPWRRGRPA